MENGILTSLHVDETCVQLRRNAREGAAPRGRRGFPVALISGSRARKENRRGIPRSRSCRASHSSVFIAERTPPPPPRSAPFPIGCSSDAHLKPPNSGHSEQNVVRYLGRCVGGFAEDRVPKKNVRYSEVVSIEQMEVSP